MAAPEDPPCRTAGRLLLSERKAAELPEPEQRETLDLLIRGKVVLFGSEDQDPAAPSRLIFQGLASPVLEARLASERSRCDAQRLAFFEAQEHLERAGIPLLLFKSGGPYPYTSSNVDVLVPAHEMDRAARLLEEAGHHEMVHYWEPNKRLLRRFRGPVCEVMIHLHTKISWVVLAFSDVAAVWEKARRRLDPRVLHPCPEHLASILLAHSVYESNKVHAGDVWKVREATGSTAFDWDEVLRIARLRAWSLGLAFSLQWYAAAESLLFGSATLGAAAAVRSLPTLSEREREWIETSVQRAFPALLPRRVTKRFYFRKLLADNPRSLGEKLHDLTGVAEQIAFGRAGLRSRPGSLVCFCGIDGSGKSTHAQALRAALDECEIPNRPVWMRGGYSPLVTRLKQGLRGSAAGLPDTGDAAGKLRLYRKRRTRFVWGWLVAIEQVVQSVFAVRIQRWLGRTLVAERYVPDTLVDLSERFADESFQTRLAGRFMRRLCPRPDLILFLDLPGALAFSRKSDDWSAEILEDRRRRYRSVLSGLPEVETLDATRSLEQLTHEATDLGLRRIFGRIRRLNPLSRRRRDSWE